MRKVVPIRGCYVTDKETEKLIKKLTKKIKVSKSQLIRDLVNDKHNELF